MAMRNADVGEHEPEIIVNLGHGPDGRSWIRGGRFLLDRNRRRQTVNQIDVRLLHLLEILPGVGRERLHIPPLSLGVNRVEGERRLARPGQTGNDHQLVAWNVDVDVPEVMNAGAAYCNPAVTHQRTFLGTVKPTIVLLLDGALAGGIPDRAELFI